MQDRELVMLVYAAKEGGDAADRLISRYLPFIKSETAKFIRRIPMEGQDDELSIAMFAFYEAAMAYEKDRGAFLSFAARAIRNRLIDYSRKESRHAGQLSLDREESDSEGNSRTLLEKLDAGHDNVSEHSHRSATREEIMEFAACLQEYGLELGDIADNCPKQERTLAACQRALACARANPLLLEVLTSTKKLPMAQLVEGSGAERKTLERHRKYLMALLLAFTNGFEIIRSHLGQTMLVKGGATE